MRFIRTFIAWKHLYLYLEAQATTAYGPNMDEWPVQVSSCQEWLSMHIQQHMNVLKDYMDEDFVRSLVEDASTMWFFV